MNLNILEKIAREVKKGNQVMHSVVNPTQHRDLSSLSMQIAANMRVNTSGMAIVAMEADPTAGIRWF